MEMNEVKELIKNKKVRFKIVGGRLIVTVVILNPPNSTSCFTDQDIDVTDWTKDEIANVGTIYIEK